MKKIMFAVLIVLTVASPSLLMAEEVGTPSPSSKETLIAQESSDMKRALYEVQRDLQILSRRMDRFDDKVNRIDRDVKDLKMR